MTCRTEKQSISLSSERLVINVNCNSVGSLVLESESDIILHTILSLISSLDLSICLLEKLLMLRRNSHHKISGAILILHIILGLNKMLSKSSSDLTICILMELKHTLRLSTIAHTLVSKSLCKNRLPVFRTSINSLTEKLRSVESKRLDLIHELRSRSSVSKLLTLLQRIKTAEKILEHT